MSYTQKTCPVCNRSVEAVYPRGELHPSIGLHTRLDGSGVLCEGVGHILAPEPKKESHS
jgi:hypothetical protein